VVAGEAPVPQAQAGDRDDDGRGGGQAPGRLSNGADRDSVDELGMVPFVLVGVPARQDRMDGEAAFTSPG